MERYEIYAKDMFEEFKKYSSRKKEASLYQLNGGSGNGNGNARKCLRYWIYLIFIICFVIKYNDYCVRNEDGSK